MRHVNELDIVTYAFFCDGTSDGRALHFTLRVNYDTGVVLKHRLSIERLRAGRKITYLKVEEDTVLSAPCLTLADDDSGHG